MSPPLETETRKSRARHPSIRKIIPNKTSSGSSVLQGERRKESKLPVVSDGNRADLAIIAAEKLN